MIIVSANFFAANKTPIKATNKLDSLAATSMGLQEAHHRLNLIKMRLINEYQFFAGLEGGKGGKEVPVLIRRGTTEYLGDSSYLVSDRTRADNTGIAPDRYLTWVRYKHNSRKYCHINIHPNAAVQNRETGEPLPLGIKRVREYVKSMKALETEIKRHTADGYIVVVTGDLNYRVRKGITLWKWSPVAIFNRTGLDFYAEGLDYVAWNKHRLAKRKVSIIHEGETGSDHPWLVADLRAI